MKIILFLNVFESQIHFFHENISFLHTPEGQGPIILENPPFSMECWSFLSEPRLSLDVFLTFLGTSHAEWSVLKPPGGSNNKRHAWGPHGFNSTERYFFRKMLLSLRPNEGYAVTLANNNYLLRNNNI